MERFIRPVDLGVGSVFEGASKKPSQEPSSRSFAEILKDAIGEVNRLQKEARQAIEDLAVGKEENIEKVVFTLQKADVALRLLVEVRNKAIEAYQEIMRMQV